MERSSAPHGSDWLTDPVELEAARAALARLGRIWYSQNQLRTEWELGGIVHAVAVAPGEPVFLWLGINRDEGHAAGIGDRVTVRVLHAERSPDDARVYLVTSDEQYVGEVKWRAAVPTDSEEQSR